MDVCGMRSVLGWYYVNFFVDPITKSYGGTHSNINFSTEFMDPFQAHVMTHICKK